MVDAFPLSAADSDREIQLLIDADLRTCHQRNDEFEKAFPEDPTANVRTLFDRVRERPRIEARCPALTAAEDRQPWVLPILRRLNWHDAHGEKDSAWSKLLSEMLAHAMSNVRRVTEAEFIALTDQLDRRTQRYKRQMSAFARQLEKDGPLSASVVDAIGRLRRLSDRRHVDISERSSLVWLLFRCETGFDEPESGWSKRVHRDLMSMEPKRRALWMSALSDAPSPALGQPSRPWLTALKHLGNGELEDGLWRWIGMLGDAASSFTPVDAFVLRAVIVLCAHLGGPACDQLLYDIARAPWTQKPEHAWMFTYLLTIDRCSQDRAFACVEALMMNPVSALPNVRRRYEALLAVFGATAVSGSPVGVDGFPLDSDPELLPIQERIDQLLHMAARAAAAGPYQDPSVAARLAALRSAKTENLSPAMQAAANMWEAQMTRPLPWFRVAPEVTAAHDAMKAAIFKEFSADSFGLYRAAMERSKWIAAHEGEYAKDTLRLWREWLGSTGRGGLTGQAFAKLDELPLAWLLPAVRQDGGSGKLFELCEKHVARHGWSAELLTAFRQWIPRIGIAAGDRMLRARAEWFVWFDNVTPIDPAACWSHWVKRDLCGMPPKEASAWRALLENNTFIITGKPPKKWLKAAEVLFSNVGAEAFRRHFVEWFAPFANGERLRLTVTGRNVLRPLMWYVLIAKDSAVDQALLGFARANWKTKDAANRAAQAEMAFAHVISQRAPETALPILEPLVVSGQAFAGSTTHRVYTELCARWNHQPVAAVRKESTPKPRAPHPILDNLTVGEYRSMMQQKLGPRLA